MEFNKKNIEIIKSGSRIKDFDYEMNKALKNLEQKLEQNPSCKLIMAIVKGSVSHNLDLETSDIDLCGFYIQDADVILSDFKLGSGNNTRYKATIGGADKKSKTKTKDDVKLYEISKFFDMLNDNNPDILEILHTDKKFIVYEHPIWSYIWLELSKMELITKKCKNGFSSYAMSQINKATGLNKKVNNPIAKEKKTPIDFCYVIPENSDKVKTLRKWLDDNKIDQRFCGLVNVPHSRGLYSLYYDSLAASVFSEKYKAENSEHLYNMCKENECMGKGYKGIIKEEEGKEISQQLRCSSIPKDDEIICRISYNEDGFVKYCKDYREIWGKNGWMEQRNEQRFKDNIEGGQNYDSKNILHVIRLLTISHEIASGKGINIYRTEDRDYLLSIKKHKLTYEEIMSKANVMSSEIEQLFADSNLPENIDTKRLEEILYNVRLMEK